MLLLIYYSMDNILCLFVLDVYKYIHTYMYLTSYQLFQVNNRAG